MRPVNRHWAPLLALLAVPGVLGSSRSLQQICLSPGGGAGATCSGGGGALSAGCHMQLAIACQLMRCCSKDAVVAAQAARSARPGTQLPARNAPRAIRCWLRRRAVSAAAAAPGCCLLVLKVLHATCHVYTGCAKGYGSYATPQVGSLPYAPPRCLVQLAALRPAGRSDGSGLCICFKWCGAAPLPACSCGCACRHAPVYA